jgi:hypothetical protein
LSCEALDPVTTAEFTFSGIVSGVSSNNASVPGGIAAGATVTGFFEFANTGQSPWSTNPTVGESRYVSEARAASSVSRWAASFGRAAA